VASAPDSSRRPELSPFSAAVRAAPRRHERRKVSAVLKMVSVRSETHSGGISHAGDSTQDAFFIFILIENKPIA